MPKIDLKYDFEHKSMGQKWQKNGIFSKKMDFFKNENNRFGPYLKRPAFKGKIFLRANSFLSKFSAENIYGKHTIQYL